MQLSKAIAKRGYIVTHTYAQNLQTPHGNMEDVETLFPTLSIKPIFLKEGFNKYSLLKRRKNEIEYANLVCEIVQEVKPDIFISANTPLFAQDILMKHCSKNKIKFINWCQDVHSVAIKQIAKKKFGFLGFLISSYFEQIEKKQLFKSDFIISITDEFLGFFENWNIDKHKIKVIPNWAPLNEMPIEPKINSWSIKHGLQSKMCILYSGTLGLKHNPSLILDAAKFFSDNQNIVFVVISEGMGANFLKKQKEKLQLNNLLLMNYQDYSLLPKVLGTADILLSILEAEAAKFSVPSKVLTYLTAGKPIVLSIPSSNLSAKIVTIASAGICVEAGESINFIKALEKLLHDTELRLKFGKNGRNYAEKNFKIDEKCDQFLEICKTLI